MIKGSIQQKEKIINLYASNKIVSKYMKQKLPPTEKGEIKSHGGKRQESKHTYLRNSIKSIGSKVIKEEKFPILN